METTPLEAQILEIMLSELREEATVYGLLKKGIPRGSSHQGLMRLEERGFARSRWEGGKKVYSLTDAGRATADKLHVPRGERSFPYRWQKWNQGRFGDAFSNIGGGEARAFIIGNSGAEKQVTFPVMASMVTSTTSETFQFERISGRPVIQYDPLCRNCGGKLSSAGKRMYCSRCDSLL